ncbi:MAG: M23 family metallopeptidase [Thermoleophilia bacterium]
MWKRMLSCCFMLLAVLSFLMGARQALAACGVEPRSLPENLAWPANGPITTSWTLDCATDRGHRGIDIAAPAGSQVTASAAGTVIFRGYTPAEGGGITVSIEHADGLRTTYLHLVQAAVTSGQHVDQGQLLALADITPLHFGLKQVGPRDVYFNPLDFLPIQVAEAETSSAPETSAVSTLSPYISPITQNSTQGNIQLTEAEPLASSPSVEPFANSAGFGITNGTTRALNGSSLFSGSSSTSGEIYTADTQLAAAILLTDSVMGKFDGSSFSSVQKVAERTNLVNSRLSGQRNAATHISPLSRQGIALLTVVLMLMAAGMAAGKITSHVPRPIPA